jgi:5-methylcytosine-specific restriction protein A
MQASAVKPYLETHHVISLSEQGPGKVTNVIALCPNDHRRDAVV